MTETACALTLTIAVCLVVRMLRPPMRHRDAPPKRDAAVRPRPPGEPPAGNTAFVQRKGFLR